MKKVEISITPEAVKSNQHLLALFNAADEIEHIQVEKTNDVPEEAGEGQYWDVISGKGLNTFFAKNCAGCYANGEQDVILSFTGGGVFTGWRV